MRSELGGALFHPDVHDCTGHEHQKCGRVECSLGIHELLTNAGQFLRLVTATSTADPLGVARIQQAEQAAD
jgi:hypothetical protein